MNSRHTPGPTSRINRKQRIKECSYMELACSNIAMQRAIKDHTSYMTRVRTKCEIDGEIFVNWSASAWETLRLLHNTRKWGITRDGQGCHHLSPTPQPWDTVISEGSHAPEHHARVQGNYPYPPRTPTLRIDKQEYGQTRRNDELSPQP